MAARGTIRFWIAVLGAVGSFALSWPYLRTFEYWAESRQMWWVYFVVGFILAVYVFIIFLRSLSTLFDHDALNRKVGSGRPPAVADEEARS